MFRLLKILGVVPTRSLSSALTPKFKVLPLGSSLVGSPVPLAVRSKGGASKSSSCSTSKSKSSDKSKPRPKPSCKRTARKKSCSKVSAPSPSYSECRREPTAPKPFKECDCGDFDKC